MRIEKFVNEDFGSNTYFISVRNHRDVIIIDPTGNCEQILARIKENNYRLQYVILTHEHFDHITGTNILKKTFPDCEIVCSKNCALGIIDAKLNLSYYKGSPYVSHPADIVVEGSKVLKWLHSINCFPWDGHSPGGMLLHMNGVLFCGDQFIKGIKTVTNLPGSKKEKVKECFDFIGKNFPVDTTIYPGHGEKMLMNELMC